MSRKWTLLTLILFLGSSGTLQAKPLDSPGVVYIDGQPCNSACQSYMAGLTGHCLPGAARNAGPASWYRSRRK